MIRDSAGNLYGTTYGGGAYWGVVYKLDTTMRETVLYTFPEVDGLGPTAGVTRDGTGNIYGTTFYGGAENEGAVYKLDSTGRQTILHSFTGGVDGASPGSSLILDPAGNIYGTTPSGGTANCGLIYKLDPAGQETVLYSFSCGADGSKPQSGVIRDSAGNLYGTAPEGGALNGGVAYKLDTTGHEIVLHSFGGVMDGAGPAAGLIRDSGGNFYGTTFYGGANNAGVVYKLDPSGHETVLYNFTGGTDGNGPQTGVILDSTGNLYGTTPSGGTSNAGVVYKLDTSGHETVLHNFTGGADGGTPSGLIRDSAGNIYGTTQSGGASYVGLVYKLDSTGHQTVLYGFTGGDDGGRPYAGVTRDSAGNLYGTTIYGGTMAGGVVFKIMP